MTNLELLALEVSRMKHRDKIMKALPAVLSTKQRPIVRTDNQEDGKEE